MAFTKIAPAGLSTTGTVAIQNINATGIITAISFSGDGSQLTNLSGMGVAAGPTGFGAEWCF